MHPTMHPRILASLFAAAFAMGTGLAHAQSGLRLPQRDGTGLDPTLARGWLAPEYDRFGFARHYWRDMVGFAPRQRMNWAYAFSERGSLGLSYSSSRDPLDTPGIEARQYGVSGRYAFSQEWALSAEAVGREPGAVLRLNDLRIGVQRRF